MTSQADKFHIPVELKGILTPKSSKEAASKTCEHSPKQVKVINYFEAKGNQGALPGAEMKIED